MEPASLHGDSQSFHFAIRVVLALPSWWTFKNTTALRAASMSCCADLNYVRMRWRDSLVFRARTCGQLMRENHPGGIANILYRMKLQGMDHAIRRNDPALLVDFFESAVSRELRGSLRVTDNETRGFSQQIKPENGTHLFVLLPHSSGGQVWLPAFCCAQNKIRLGKQSSKAATDTLYDVRIDDDCVGGEWLRGTKIKGVPLTSLRQRLNDCGNSEATGIVIPEEDRVQGVLERFTPVSIKAYGSRCWTKGIVVNDNGKCAQTGEKLYDIEVTNTGKVYRHIKRHIIRTSADWVALNLCPDCNTPRRQFGSLCQCRKPKTFVSWVKLHMTSPTGLLYDPVVEASEHEHAMFRSCGLDGIFLQILLAFGCSPSDSALRIACSHGRLRSVEILIAAGASPLMADSKGVTPLYLTVYHGFSNILGKLVKFIDPDTVFEVLRRCMGRNQESLIHVACADFQTCCLRCLLNLAIKKKMHAGRRAEILKTVNKLGRTPFHVAVSTGSMQALDILLHFLCSGTFLSPASPCADSNESLSLITNHDTLVKDVLSCTDTAGRGLLHIAAEALSSNDILKFLVRSGISINQRDGNGKLPTHSALTTEGSLEERIRVSLFFLNVGTNTDVACNAGYTILHYCCLLEPVAKEVLHVTELTSRILQLKANPDQMTCSGKTPLALAAMQGRYSLGKCLVDNGANPQRQDATGHKPCDYLLTYLKISELTSCANRKGKKLVMESRRLVELKQFSLLLSLKTHDIMDRYLEDSSDTKDRHFSDHDSVPTADERDNFERLMDYYDKHCPKMSKKVPDLMRNNNTNKKVCRLFEKISKKYGVKLSPKPEDEHGIEEIKFLPRVW